MYTGSYSIEEVIGNIRRTGGHFKFKLRNRGLLLDILNKPEYLPAETIVMYDNAICWDCSEHEDEAMRYPVVEMNWLVLCGDYVLIDE